MATQFSELQKLLINVAAGKCDAFIKAHVNNTWPVGDNVERPSELPEFTAGENDTYFNKVVFLQKYNTIYTKGTFFGYSGDLKASFDDLVEVLTTGTTANGITIKYNPDATNGPAIETTVVAAEYDKEAKTWKNIDNVITGSNVKTYVDAQVAGAVAEATAAMNFKGSIDNAADLVKQQGLADNGDVFVVGTDFTSGEKQFESGDLIIFRKDGARTTYTVVQKNLDGAVEKDITWSGVLESEKVAVAIGANKVKPTSYTLGGGTFATTGDSSYILATEAGVTAAISGAIDAIDEPKSTHTGTYMTYAYSTTNGITWVESIDPILAEYKVTTNERGETTLDNTGKDGLVDNNALNTVIGYLDGKINAVDCEVTTLTEVDGDDYLKVTESKTGNDRNYEIELNVVNLGDAVGMTYDEATGKWSAPEGNPDAKNGLASAADVANELVSDEKVIAAALNDHEARLDVLEAFADDINGTIQDQLVIGDVKVTGLKAEVATAGLVNADLLVSVINALDPWEDYK